MSGILQTLFLGAVATVKDAYFNLVTLLLNTTSTNGAQNNTFLDSSTNNFTITRNGNTTQGTFTPFSQTGWSNYFDGSSATLISSGTPMPTSGDFTVECWIYPISVSGSFNIVWEGNATNALGCAINSNGTITYGRVLVATDGTTSNAVNFNQWNHIAHVRSSGTLKIYVNGVLGLTASVGTTYTSAAARLASDANNTLYYNGYISNFRVTNTVVYSSAFTPPTSPLTAISGTSILTSQSNRFLDNSGNALTFTTQGTPSVQAFSPFAPTTAYDTAVVGGSGYFDGSGDYLTWTGSTVGTAAYTFECWFYTPSFGSSQTLIGPNSTTNGGYGFNVASATSLSIDNYGIAANNFTVPTIAANAWHHVAVVRNGSGVTTVFLDGVRSSTGTITDTNNYGNVKSIGYTSSAVNRYFNGYISSPRYVTSAVYDPTQTTITVPTAPLTAITNTQLLLSATNAGIYDSAAKNDLETVGNAQVSTTQAKWGSTSMYFDGTGDYLVGRTNPAYSYGTGAFTWEAWVYPTATKSVAAHIYDTLPPGGTGSRANSMIWGINSSNKLFVFTNGSSAIVSSGSISLNTWTHVAFVREGTGTNQTKFYINGTNDGTGTVSTNDTLGGQVIGASADDLTNNNAMFQGYMDDLRLTKGYARYTANFTPPAAAFPIQ